MISVKGFDSVLVSGVAYTNKVLAVSLKSGRTYLYTNVPKRVAEAFLSAESKGEFFNKSVKGKYQVTEV